MRLRLIVRRNALPDASIIWDVVDLSILVSQLVEQINEVIPIESGEWGLEDYVVEVLTNGGRGFECFHFQVLGRVCKEDDEVLIRPLLTQDLRVRKISGRHQITSDGRHLVDGVAYGRPRLRGPTERPAINIPPRKRRRAVLDEDSHYDLSEENDEESEDDDDDEMYLDSPGDEPAENKLVIEADDGNSQLVIRANFEDDDSDEESEDEEDGDFEPAGVEKDEDAEIEVDDDELEALQEETEEFEASSTSAKFVNLCESFPDAPEVICRQILDKNGGDESLAWTALALAFKPAKSKPKFAATEPQKLVLKDDTEIDMVDEDGEPFPEEYENSLLDYYDQNGLPPGSISISARGNRVVKFTDEDEDVPVGRPDAIDMDEDEPDDEDLEDNEEEKQNQDEDEDDDEDENGSDDENPLLSYYDQNGLPPGSISVSARSNKVIKFADEDEDEDMPIVNPDAIYMDEDDESEDEDFDDEGGNKDESSGEDSEDESKELQAPKSASSDSSNSGDDSSDDSSEDSSDSDTDSDSDSDSGSDAEAQSSSNLDSGSDSSSDSEPEEISSKEVSSRSPNAGGVPTIAPKKTVPPGQGLKKTKSRNQRRRHTHQLKRYQATGILPAGTTLRQFADMGLGAGSSPEEASAAFESSRVILETPKEKKISSKAKAQAEEFEARRSKLLASLASGGVDVSNESQPKPSKNTSTSSQAEELEAKRRELLASLASGGVDVSNDPQLVPSKKTPAPTQKSDSEIPESTTDAAQNMSSIGNEEGVPVEQETSNAVDKPQNPKTTELEPNSRSEKSPRRSKLDLGAGRRLLFGALGIKPPKSKADEEKVKNDLKFVRQVKTTTEAEENTSEAPVGDGDDSWREKIILRAVECCQEGIELSEPPFPFIQRWDPQQRTGGRNSRKKNKRKREEQYDEYYDESYTAYDDGTQLNYDDSMQQDVNNSEAEAAVKAAIEDQIMMDTSQFTTASIFDESGDLPELPEDMSTLANLSKDDANPGMIIAYKELTMSEATNWQPQMSTYRTAVVIGIADGGEINITLAKRDRTWDNKYYDEETGERIYGKFEMPQDEEDEEEAEDDGRRTLVFSEFVEPKIVQAAPASLSAENSTGKQGGSTDESTTLDQDHQPEELPTKLAKAEAAGTPNVGDKSPPSKLGGLEDDMLINIISDNIRDEISMMIKDAGFRSDVPSPLRDAQLSISTPSKPEVFEKKLSQETDMSKIPSPRFNGFGSSPLQPDHGTSLSLLDRESPIRFRPTELWPSSQVRSLPPPQSADQQSADEQPTKNGAQSHDLNRPSTASEMGDYGHQPDDTLLANKKLKELEEYDSFLRAAEGHAKSPKLESSIKPSQYTDTADDVFDNGFDSISDSDSDSDSDPDCLPPLEKLESTARPMSRSASKAASLSREQPPPRKSKADKEYHEAMAKLDASLLDGY